ncbi:DegT/DnrJ/EryC1/StrS family aminotransferase [Stappia sp. F7233]|uniref:DegT/DnrJ/EryC1/StrS family aminotransferase n=1 Tax=Stappia albiluteola TaxID=2758565 RepID=A0A839AIF2_9HYPH|nr:DegT/DnrJ/EryC1/StrS family aminotransferase [Stappia albiluteola]MBA5778527.1 DegT/DnrJ/EryC1/StrS family aminotransferase [Stappia albiluteola]
MAASDDFIPVAGPSITDREVEYAADAARNAWYQNHYSFNARFETLFAETIGVAHAVSLPHCTAAIHLALAARGIGPGDEVIVPDVTWIASIAPVDYVGATPIFVDILPDTWCIDPDAVEAAITDRTKAIIAVDLYGSMADWRRLRKIADRHGLFLLEDSAEALGSTYDDRQAGSHGDVGVFSFHGSKTVATGEGGMLVTGDPALFARVMTLRDHGRPPGDRFFINTEVAFKYKMSAVQAALGLAQMERFDELIAAKRKIFASYKERLGDLQGVAFNAEPEGTENSFWMVTVIPDAEYGLDKFAIMEELKARNIDSRPFFSPLSTIPAYEGRQQSKRFLPAQPKGHAIANYGVNLPSGYHMDEAKIDRVAKALSDILRK